MRFFYFGCLNSSRYQLLKVINERLTVFSMRANVKIVLFSSLIWSYMWNYSRFLSQTTNIVTCLSNMKSMVTTTRQTVLVFSKIYYFFLISIIPIHHSWQGLIPVLIVGDIHFITLCYCLNIHLTSNSVFHLL